MHQDIIQLFLLSFADDIVLFADSVHGLQKRINGLECFCESNQFSVNLENINIFSKWW